ncbi:MAG: tyrosine-type recombinase/integrase [Elusimicrobia bacterium]|nr:tyrosine-type recombinase/integrase [Elusimicrobiota bacterium]
MSEFSDHLTLEKGLSKNTATSYSYALRHFLSFLAQKGQDPAALTPAEITAYVGARAREGLKPRSLFSAVMALRRFFDFLIASRNLTINNPANAVKPPRVPKLQNHIPRILTEQEVEQLFSFPTLRYLQIRDRAALDLLYLGLRCHEVAGLQEDNLFLDRKFLIVRGKGDKERVVPIIGKARESLDLYLQERGRRFPHVRGPVLLSHTGKPMSRTAIWACVKKRARQAGIERRVFPHMLRHCFTTHAQSRGMGLGQAQEALGHSDIKTTMIYTHLDPSHLIAAYERFHPRAGGAAV